MIWIVLHWVFLFICKPQWLFHGITSLLLLLYQLIIIKKKISIKKNIQNASGIILMYCGYYLCEQLYHFAFLPFWALSVVGLRKQVFPVIILSTVTGLFFHFIVLQQVVGHVLMNIGRLVRIKPTNIESTIISHGMIFLLMMVSKGDDWNNISQRELLAVISTIHMINKFERMDIFSLCMCYTHFFALLATLLHLMVPYWFNYYENNHFYMVKGQYLFLIPIAILVQRVAYSLN